MRKLLLVLVLLCVLAFTGGAMAQTADPTLVCGTLSAADCAPLLLAAESQPSSAAYDFTVDFALETDAEELSAASAGLSGTGRYILDTSVLASLDALNDPATLQDNQALVDLLESLLTSFDASALISITSFNDGGLTGVPLPPGLALNLYLQGGVGYVDLGALNIDPRLTGVLGLDFVELLALFGPQIDLSDVSETGGVQDQLLDLFSDDEFTSRAFIVTRAADITALDGQTLAVFEGNLDLGAFFNEPDVQDALRAQLLADGGTTADDADATVNALAQGVTGTVSATQHIGTSNGYVYFASFNANVNVDLVTIAEALDATDDLGEASFIRISATGSANQRDFDSISDIGLPADAQIVPLSALGL